MTSVSDTPILELKGVSKSFGAVHALYEVDFHVSRGEVMALVGDNGAGKSTLIKCIAGIYPIDAGEVFFEGEPVTVCTAEGRRARSASRSSTRTSRCADNLDVVQNMFLGREELTRSAARSTRPRWSGAPRDARDALGDDDPVGAPDGRRPLRRPAPVGRGRQGRACGTRKVVILDEPTAALGVAQTRQVLDLVKRLGEQGLAVVLISHNLHDIFEVADNITVLRLGQNVGEFKRTDVTQTQVVEAITAGKLSQVPGVGEEVIA